jgi:hypothetical protein
LSTPLNAELFHSAAKRAGIEVQQGRCAVRSFNSPVGLHQDGEYVTTFQLFDDRRSSVMAGLVRDGSSLEKTSPKEAVQATNKTAGPIFSDPPRSRAPDR